MFELWGKISARIRGGEIPRDAYIKRRTDTAAEMPSTKAIKSAQGKGLGKGATRRRNGGAS